MKARFIHKLIPVVLVIIPLLLYLPALQFDFLSDDIPAIVQNPDIGSWRNIPNTPLMTFKAFLDVITYKLFGLSESAFRIRNILAHTGSVVMLFFVIRLLTTKTPAFLGSLLFAVHPLAVESVTWIGGGSYALYTFFFLLSFYFYLRKNSFRFAYPLSAVLFILMLTTSEKSIPLGFVFPLYELLCGNLRTNWRQALLYPGMSIIYTVIGVFGSGYLADRLHRLTTEYGTDTSGFYNPLNQIPIAITTYLELLFWPGKLSFYHSDLSFHGLGFGWKITGFLIFLSVITLQIRRNRLITFFLLTAIISLSPSLTPLKIAWVVAERYAYLATACFIITGVLLVKPVFYLKKYQPLIILFFSLITLALSTRTVIRNSDFRNQDALWIATGKTAPSDPKTHNNLGDMYGRWGDDLMARKEFELAIALNPDYADAYHNLGNVNAKLGETDRAIENYNHALSLNPKLWQTHSALATIYYSKKIPEKTVYHLNEALKIIPENPDLLTNLAIVYYQNGNTDLARESINRALSADPENKKALEINAVMN